MGRPTPATDASHGPFRKVARVVDETIHHPAEEKISRTRNRYTGEIEERPYTSRARTVRYVYEVLECGHRGDTLHAAEYEPPSWQLPIIEDAKAGRFHRKKRRCMSCRVPLCSECGEAGRDGDPVVVHHRVWGWEIHEGCKAAYDEQEAVEEAHWAKVREENLARRRAAGEDV